MRRVLITGAGGYVGSGLAESMAAAGWDVRALVRQEAPHLGVEQIVADLAQDAEAARRACEGVDAVVHLAGDNEVVAARDPAFALGGTVLATERLVEALTASRVRRFVYMSTVHVYGERMVGGALLTEDLRPEPRATYAIARLASEHIATAVSSHGLEVVVLRLTNSLGSPGHPEVDRWTLVSNDLCRQGALRGRLELQSSGAQWRDFVALRDVRAVVEAGCRADGLAPGTYNLGSGEPMTIRSLAELVQEAFESQTGSRLPLTAPDHEGPTHDPYTVSVERLTSAGLAATTPIADAVAETVRFCLDHKEAIA